MTSEIKVDTISEQTSANGVTIDGLTIKDGNIIGDVALAGTTPTFTIGDGGAEDAALIFDGNAVDYYMALDDSADNLIIGSGSTVGSNSLITIDSDGDFTLDVTGGIVLDGDDSGTISFKDGGTRYGLVQKASNNFEIQSMISDGDIVFKGSDGGSVITALTIDMSDAGTANFNNKVGINEASPASQLHITGATDAGGTISLKRPNTTVTAGQTLGAIEFITADSGSAGTAARILGEADGTGGEAKLVFNTGTGGSNSTRMIIDHDGNVKITNDANVYLSIDSTQTNGDEWHIFNAVSGTSSTLQFKNIDQSAVVMLLDESGKVGIGTTSPDRELSVGGVANARIGIISSDNSTGACQLHFGDADDSQVGRIMYEHDGNKMTFHTAATERMRIHGGGNISIGTTSDDGKVTIATSDSTAGPNSDADELFLESNGNAGMTIGSSTSTSGNIHFADNGAANRGIITYDHGADEMKFGTSGAIKMRLNSSGEFMVGKSSSGIANAGVEMFTDKLSATVSAATIMYLNRLTNDGTIAQFHQAGTEEGSIEVSGSTVSYNGFTGSHWSRLADNSKPTILRGTIMDSIDEMCDWYQAVAEVPAILWTAEDKETQDTLWTEDNTLPDDVEVGDVRWAATQTVGDVKEAAYTVKESIALGSKSVGDAITFTSEGTEFTGTIVKEDDVKHTKCKVSDTTDSKKVYGVFSNWDDADDGLDGDVNDMNIAQVGTFIIRVHKDVTVSAGDLLVSNGDGTAKKQDDDIIRSKTVAKVNSNIKVETYSDGSYTVPCTLHC